MASLQTSEILTEVKTLVGEGGTNYFSDAAYKRFISDAWMTVARMSPVGEREATDTSTAGTAQYRFSGFTQIWHVDYDDKPMTPITALQLRQWDQDWEQVDGEPTHFLMNNTNEWGILDGTTFEYQFIQLFPNPDETGLTIRVIGQEEADELSDDTDTPNFPGFGHWAIVYEAAAMVLEARGEARNPELAVAYRLLRDGYAKMVNNNHPHRSSQLVRAVGQVPTFSRLNRETSINATGKAGAGS